MASSSLKDMQGNSNKKHGSDNRKHKDEEIKIVMVHENDPKKGGCDFGLMFSTTPQELIDGGIYRWHLNCSLGLGRPLTVRGSHRLWSQ